MTLAEANLILERACAAGAFARRGNVSGAIEEILGMRVYMDDWVEYRGIVRLVPSQSLRDRGFD